VAIVRTALTVMVRDFCVVCVPSVTCTVKVEGPVPVGVPSMTPAVDKANPAGSEPDAMVHVLEPVPPVAISVCEYAIP
jgi:hypothetical protein